VRDGAVNGLLCQRFLNLGQLGKVIRLQPPNLVDNRFKRETHFTCCPI
jgi:hypothetical protein